MRNPNNGEVLAQGVVTGDFAAWWSPKGLNISLLVDVSRFGERSEDGCLAAGWGCVVEEVLIVVVEVLRVLLAVLVVLFEVVGAVGPVLVLLEWSRGKSNCLVKELQILSLNESSSSSSISAQLNPVELRGTDKLAKVNRELSILRDPEALLVLEDELVVESVALAGEWPICVFAVLFAVGWTPNLSRLMSGEVLLLFFQ